MELLILPGLGDPEANKYKAVYNLIITEAKNHNFNHIEIIKWPGQNSSKQKDIKVTLPRCVEEFYVFLKALENKKQLYSIIARSFGCIVFLSTLKVIKLKYLKKAVLWGPTSYVNHYKLFKQDYENTIKKSIGNNVNIDISFFDTIVPVEVALENFKNEFELKIACGEKDDLSDPVFLEYLKNMNPEKKIKIKTVPNVGHEVSEYNQEYISALFN